MGRRAAELIGVLVASLITSYVTGLATTGARSRPRGAGAGVELPVRLHEASDRAAQIEQIDDELVLLAIWVGHERKRAAEQGKDRFR